MKTKKILMIALVTISVSVLFSCKKEKVKGCTDSQASNFKSGAEEDDGSCTYKADAVIWWGKQLSDSASAYGITALKVYVNGTFIDSKASSTYWSSAPDFGSGISTYKDLGSSKTAAGTAELKDQSGNVIGTVPFTFDKASTVKIQFTW